MKRSRINPVSKRRASEGRVYSERRLVFLEENPLCVIHSPHCTGDATTIEHTKGRVGKLFLDEKFWKAACCPCNIYLKDNAAWATAHGHREDRLAHE